MASNREWLATSGRKSCDVLGGGKGVGLAVQSNALEPNASDATISSIGFSDMLLQVLGSDLRPQQKYKVFDLVNGFRRVPVP